MRIIAGIYRGTALASLGKGDEAARLRPTSDRVREAIFNLLAHGDYPAIGGARVLDLFAGTGALGFEALSRGAAFACFVDNGARAQALIRENGQKLQVGEAATLLPRDATRQGTCAGAAFDLVFLDPPYGRGLGPQALASALAGGWLAKGAIIVWEENAFQPPPSGFFNQDLRQYGDTFVTILKAPE